MSIVSMDPAVDFLYKPHTITALVVMFGSLAYFGIETSSVPMGLTAMLGIFMFFSAMSFRDGYFIRPHPVIWRMVLGLSLVYQMLLTFALFQNVEWARNTLHSYDSSTGRPLPERSYAGDCSLKWANIVEKSDEFVIAHVLGWLCKALVIRDYWFLWVLSIMFEICEYSLQHHLPNFAECWWDHWILDVLVCIWLGTWLGMKISSYFQMKTYNWRGIQDIPSYSGKVKRAVQQFMPYSFERFEWRITESPKRLIGAIFVLVTILVAEINAFYLKFILLIPASNVLNVIRLSLFFFCSIPAVREYYEYYNGSSTRLGTQAWVVVANTYTEVLICIKFGKTMFPEPFPESVVLFWIGLTSLLATWAVWNFYIRNPGSNQVETNVLIK